jgi:hypothetical protein
VALARALEQAQRLRAQPLDIACLHQLLEVDVNGVIVRIDLEQRQALTEGTERKWLLRLHHRHRPRCDHVGSSLRHAKRPRRLASLPCRGPADGDGTDPARLHASLFGAPRIVGQLPLTLDALERVLGGLEY